MPRFRHCMHVGLLTLLSGLLTFELPVDSGLVFAQTKTFRVRDQVVELPVAPDVLLVRPAAGAKSADISTEAIRIQAELLGLDVARVKLAGAEVKEVPMLQAFLVPRVPGVKDADLARLPERSKTIKEVAPAYRVGGQLALPSGTITVRFRFDGDPPARLLFALAQEFDLRETARPKSSAATIRFRPNQREADTFAISEALLKNQYVLWAEPDLLLEFEYAPPAAMTTAAGDSEVALQAYESLLPARRPDDPLFDRQWHLTNAPYGVNICGAWSLIGSSQPIVVAIVDTGIDLKHADLRNNLLPGYDWLDDDDDPNTKQISHATHCAGLVAAVANNRTGISGIAWNCQILPVRVMTDNGPGPWFAVAEGIAYAARSGARVINCSVGGAFPSNQLLDAIDEAANAGCLVIAASGNDNSAVKFPAAYEKCLAVGAVRSDNQKCDYSSWGESLDIVAPGGLGGGNCPGLWSTDVTGPFGKNLGANGDSRAPSEEPTGDYADKLAGTSFAAPIVTGVAALVLSNYPHLSAQQVRQILLDSATKIDSDSNLWRDGHHVYYGFGKVDAYAAMLRAAEMSGR